MAIADVEHQPEQNRFILTVQGNGEQAVLDYHMQPAESATAPAGIDFTHTYVPPAYRGQGMAEKLVRHGLDWARKQNYDITASCWYVRKFLRQ